MVGVSFRLRLKARQMEPWASSPSSSQVWSAVRQTSWRYANHFNRAKKYSIRFICFVVEGIIIKLTKIDAPRFKSARS